MSGGTNQKRSIAIAVRDGSDLFLFLTVCRGAAGDVYVNFPRDYEPDWKPHSSYHASGQHYQMSFGHKLIIRHRQRPDSSFTGSVNVVTTGVSSNEPRALNEPCVASAFREVFEIPHDELGPEKYRTLLAIDITEPNGKPTITPGAKVIRQAVYQDAVPWILVTLFDTGGDEAVAELICGPLQEA